MKYNPCTPPSTNPFRRGSRGWGGLISHHHANVVANGTTMVNVFVGWLTAIVSRQTVLFLHEETYDKVDSEFFFSIVLYKINNNKVLHLL
jgi:hypothetical protein